MDVHPPRQSPPVELLAGVATLPAEMVAQIERCATVHDVPPATVLVRQHERVHDLLVLVTGRIATLVEFPEVGDLVVETTAAPGRMFGWSGLRPPHRATATLRAEGPCRVLTLPIEPLTADRPRWEAALCGLAAADLADRARDIAARWSVGTGEPRDA